jgi:hypothetical protein
MSPCKFNNSATADIIKRGSFFSVDSPPSHLTGYFVFLRLADVCASRFGRCLGLWSGSAVLLCQIASIIANVAVSLSDARPPLPGRAVLMTETAAAVDAPGNLVTKRHHSWP